ncbi:YggS family pyridoxal phosphate-dependent enzyme [Prevotella sp. 10(H)]|uniref:YggS family pyridoxal phosphate-dependent enzyme n=1 Tax=Prevotella sp. 10(H) TaxID=1158294 RepID=UPI0004A6FA24|nr:YggS family pyridoxal phosphate-dependent enzyme [Prevotella sp. 10(H)]
MSISENLHVIKDRLPAGVKLVAVSKFHPVEAIRIAYEAGQHIFGESRMQEISQKYPLLPQDIEWHFIGHLQTNKVKSIIPYTHTIHSVDSWKLLSEIEKYASRIGKRIRCLLEIYIAQEDAKYGLSFDECRQLLAGEQWREFNFAYIGGVMGMASNVEDENQIRKEFKSLKLFFDEIKNDYFSDNNDFCEISMGMSGDYKIAIEEGSTMIRVGSSIFGDREY